MRGDEVSVMKLTKTQDDADEACFKVELEEVEMAPCENNECSSQEATAKDLNVVIDEKRLMRRIDLHLIPWLCIPYLLCFLDRAGIGNARLYGMEDDLHMSDKQYLLCLSMFFVSYAVFEAPANMCLKLLKPAIWLSTTMLMWGIIMTIQGLVRNFGGLLVIRLMLGLFEAAFFPGAAFYLSCWYKRNEIGLRLAVFNSAVTSAGAFGGLLAAAISNMEGISGKPAWAWIFIIEGLLTVLVGIACFFLIHDYPSSARFLCEQERAYVVRRLQTDNQFSAGGEDLRWRDARKSLTEWKTWIGALVLIGVDGPLYAFSLFLPSIISQLGFTANRSNLLTVPVYVFACFWTCVVGFAADRTQRRGYFAIGLSLITATGYIILIFSRNPALSYIATYVAAVGIFPSIPNAVAWVGNNVEGSYKRSITMAIGIGCGNLTGAFTSNTYRSRDTPWYTLGHGITLMFISIGLIGSITFHFLLKKENERRDRGERDEVIGGDPEKKGMRSRHGHGDPRNGCYESLADARRDKGDEWSGFRYVV